MNTETLLGSSALSAFVAGIFLWLSNRKPKPSVQAEAFAATAAGQVSIAAAFGTLVDQMQEEITRKESELVAMRADLHKLRNRLSSLDGFARALLKHLDVQDAMIVALGGTPPERPKIPEPV